MDNAVRRGLELLDAFEKGDDAIKSAFINLYQDFSGENLVENILNKINERRNSARDARDTEEASVPFAALGINVEHFVADLLLKQDPTYALTVALMIEDFVETAFEKLQENQKLLETQKLLESDKQIALAALLDLLIPMLGLPPAVTVSALLIKLGVKGALGIGPRGPSFDASFIGRQINRIFRNVKRDHFWLNYAAAKLHRRKNYAECCKKRLARCESICRENSDYENLNHVGYEFIEIGEIAKGMKLVEEALTKLPEQPGIIDSVSWAYFKMGKVRRSRKLILKALRKENEVREKYGEEGWLELVFHAVLIFEASKDSKNRDKYYEVLRAIDKKEQWTAQI